MILPLRILAGPLVGLAIAADAPGQHAPPSDSVPARDDRPTVLPPIVTSAQRAGRLDAPGAVISLVDTTRLRRSRTIGLHETLRALPGVQVTSRNGTDDVNLGVRGSAARVRQIVRGVAVFLDGVALTEPDGGARLDLLELANAGEIQVVRGPGSAAWPDPGGVVNVVSRNGRDSPGVEARGQVGAFESRKVNARAGTTFGQARGSGLASASRTVGDGYRAHAGAAISRAHVAVDYLVGGTVLGFQATGSRLDSELPGSLTQGEVDTDPDVASPLATTFDYGRRDDRYRLGGRVESRVRDAVIDAHVFYGRRTLFFPIPAQIVDLDLGRAQAGARFRTDPIAGSPLGFAAGVNYDVLYGTDRRWWNEAGTPGALRDVGTVSVPAVGVYAETLWWLRDGVTASAGLRYDRVSYAFESEMPGVLSAEQTAFDQVSPRLGARWELDGATSLFAAAGRGFEVPAIGEVSPSPSAPFTSARPRSQWTYEIGARRSVAGRVSIGATLFLADVRGAFVPVTVDGTSRAENASRSRHAGIELEGTAPLAPWLDLGLAYAFLDLRFTEYTTALVDSTGTPVELDYAGNRMPGVPRDRLTGSLTTRPADRLELGLELEWQGVVYVESGNRDAGTWYVSTESGGPVEAVPFRAVPPGLTAHASLAWVVGPATLFANVANLGSRTTTVVANESLGRFYEPGAPASVSIGLSLAGRGPAAP